MQLTAELIEAFAGLFLSPRYDNPRPTPQFHRDCWKLYCSDAPMCAVAAPRNHAKSTALSHDYILASALFRVEPYIIFIGSTEEMAIEHLGDISNELHENEALITEFGVKGFITDSKTDIIVELHDGYQFRIVARGAEQRIRGRKWRGRRPGLIVFDDIEEDEQVESADRRAKFRRWFFRACKQAMRDGGKMRGHGTILHEDSLLSRLMRDSTWNHKLYKAHKGFNDFTEILWEQKFPEKVLRNIRQQFINQGDAAGYSQEYLNDPFDHSDNYLARDDFLGMNEEDHEEPKRFYVGCDFAVSKADTANRTSFTIAGRSLDNLLHFVDERVDRWDTLEWIEVMFEINHKWDPDYFFVEDGAIWKAIAPMLFREMQRRDEWLQIIPITPMKDKAVRGRPFQKRMRSGGCRFDKEADWYTPFEVECLRFTGHGEAIADDQFDSAAILCKGLEMTPDLEEGDLDEEEWSEEEEEIRAILSQRDGRNGTTGY